MYILVLLVLKIEAQYIFKILRLSHCLLVSTCTQHLHEPQVFRLLLEEFVMVCITFVFESVQQITRRMLSLDFVGRTCTL